MNDNNEKNECLEIDNQFQIYENINEDNFSFEISEYDVSSNDSDELEPNSDTDVNFFDFL